MTPQQPYPYPPVAYVTVQPQNTGAATAALVLGCLSFLTCGMTAIPAVICGMVSLTTKNSGGRSSAVVGTVLGGVWVLSGAVFLLATVVTSVTTT